MAWPGIGAAESNSNMFDTNSQQSDGKLAAWAWLDARMGWLKSREKAVLAVGLGFQIIVLLAMIASPLTTLLTGDTILLHVQPVDPRDLFRGDYVILGYAFSRVPPQAIPGLSANEWQGRTVYVTLAPEEDGKHWRASGYSFQRPSGGKFLRGEIKRWNQIEFGIESYFVEEGKGRKYELAVRRETLSVEVALDRNGKAVLKRLVID